MLVIAAGLYKETRIQSTIQAGIWLLEVLSSAIHLVLRVFWLPLACLISIDVLICFSSFRRMLRIFRFSLHYGEWWRRWWSLS